MKTVLMTTDSHHHRYFAEQVARVQPWQRILLARPAQAAPREPDNTFDQRNDAYDREALPVSGYASMSSMAEASVFDSFGSAEFTDALRREAPDLAIVFGTDRLSSEIASIPRVATLNLHAGDSESYRGLDTHLWAIYHNEFDRLSVTMHHVEAVLDGGRIVLQDDLPIERTTKIWHLRALRTRVHIDLTSMAIDAIRRTGRLPGRRPRTLGRYYSHMPASLKSICEKKFDCYVATL